MNMKMEKVTQFKYLGETTHLKDTTTGEIYTKVRAAWSCFGYKTTTNKQTKNMQLPISSPPPPK